MRNNDQNLSKPQILQGISDAVKSGDSDKFAEFVEQLAGLKASEMLEDAAQRTEDAVRLHDETVLAQRGKKVMTSDERKYFVELAKAMNSSNPKQAISDLNLAFPVTTFNSVMDDIRQAHPLLSRINFVRSSGAFRMLMNAAGVDTAVWGDLCDEIVKEIAAGFKVVDGTLCKLSAFMLVCKSGEELSPDWVHEYVVEVMREALAAGLEAGIVDGTGKSMPIGMTRQVGEGVSVVGGVYPRKEAIAVNDLSAATVGNLLAQLATSEAGRPRVVNDIILLCSPADYYSKILPAMTFVGADGVRRDASGFNIEVIQTTALEPGEAVIGMGKQYFAVAGMPKEGRVTFDDSNRFLEDERVYLVKLYANGMPKDNNSFLLLDVTNLQPAYFRVVSVTEPTASDDTTLSALKIGALTLTPTFDPDTDTYTAATTNAKNVINAVPANAGASISITNNAAPVANGSAIEWAAGENTVVVTVTAQNGDTDAYTITVTKS